MARRIRYIGLVFLAAFSMAALAISAAFFWRLSQGPVSLPFLKNTVQQHINNALPDVDVAISGVVVEKDEKTGQPRLRLRDIQFKNLDGRLIARAPRAAISLRNKALLTGRVIPRSLELIGTRLLIQRGIDGSIGLGFGGNAGSDAKSAENFGVERKAAGKTANDEEFFTTQAANVLQFLDGSAPPGASGAASAFQKLESVRITKTAITLFDEANGAVWFSPDASLVFRRVADGFAMFVDGSIAARSKPWRVEVTAHYRKSTHKFKISSRVFDVIPAELARDVFALSELAQVRLPLSGHVEAEFTSHGKLTKASAELTASAGRVGFPEYISEPIIVDEGLVRLDLDPATGDIVIGNSAIFIGGSQAQLTGRIIPKRNADDHLTGLGIKLAASNLAIDPSGGAKKPVMFSKVTFDGLALLKEAKLVVNDLTMVQGSAGIRLRGQFVGGEKAAGVFVSGRIRDLPATTIKRLWPPIVARGARKWINENVVDALMSDGTFQIAIPAKNIIAAINDQPIPDKMVDFRFKLKNVSTGYYGELPKLEKSSGAGVITGNNFTLALKGGSASLPGDRVVKLVRATMKSTDLATLVSPTRMKVELAGTARSVLTLINHKPLNLLAGTNIGIKDISGNARLTINLDMPLSVKMREDEVAITATARWTNGGFKNAIEGADVTKADIAIVVNETQLKARGTALIDKLPAQVGWTQKLVKNKSSPATLEIRATVTENKRKQLGVDLSRFVRGLVGLKIVARTQGNSVSSMQVEADLSKAILALDEINWVHPAGIRTIATFKVIPGKKTRKIKDLKISGKDLLITGTIDLDTAGQIRKADFKRFRLDRRNDMSLAIRRSTDALILVVGGRSFDARRLINRAFSPAAAPKKFTRAGSPPVSVKVNIANIIANRGEQIKNATGIVNLANGKVQTANLRGLFVGGAPVSLKTHNGPQGGRLQVVTRDAGAALRAANLYSKISGGTLSLDAILSTPPRTGIKKGLLVMRHFLVRDDSTFETISAGAKLKSGKFARRKRVGPRKSGQRFTKFKLPFSTDAHFVRIGDALLSGSELGASANGRIRKIDGAMDIAGTIIPAYELNAAVGGVPLLGQILTGGQGEGIFGVSYALQGTMARPKFVVNPVSAIAPGFLRKLFAIGGGGNVSADGTGVRKAKTLNADR